MDFKEVELILEKREYKHRPGYNGNKKGSYIEKGKTYWDYSGGATPGNERLTTQIQSKIIHKFDAYASREDIKNYLKTEDCKKLFEKLRKIANKKFGSDEDDPKWRAYVYGGLSTSSARIIANKKGGKEKGMKYLI